jgi:hypothetical protein
VFVCNSYDSGMLLSQPMVIWTILVISVILGHHLQRA